MTLQTKGNAVAAAVVEDVDVFFVQTEHDLLKNMLEILVSTPPHPSKSTVRTEPDFVCDHPSHTFLLFFVI